MIAVFIGYDDCAGFLPRLPQNPTGSGAQAGRPTLNTGPRARFDRKRFNKCLQSYFGIEPGGSGGAINPFWDRRYGGSFAGIATGNPGHRYSVVTNINRHSTVLAQDLNRANNTPGRWITQSGISLASDVYGRWGVNYIASDVAANPIYLDIGVLAAYVHELGNTLGVETGMPDPYGGYAAENAKFGVSDPDVGAAFERCVFGGLVGLRTGRLGSNREF